MSRILIFGVLMIIVTATQASLNYKILERKMLNDALIFSVTTEQIDKAKEIANELVEKNSGRFMIRIYFYSSDSIPGNDMALILFEWTRKRGMVKTFDTQLPTLAEGHDKELPDYEVLFRVRQIHNKRIYGDVLVPSLSRTMPVKKREQIARAISEREKLDDIALYSTRDAYKANMSASFLRSHPDALKQGYLGSLNEGGFMPGEELNP